MPKSRRESFQYSLLQSAECFFFFPLFFFFSIESWPRRVRRRESEEEVSSASLFRHRMRRGPRADKYQPLSLFRHKSQRAARREAAEEEGGSRGGRQLTLASHARQPKRTRKHARSARSKKSEAVAAAAFEPSAAKPPPLPRVAPTSQPSTLLLRS